MDKKLIIILSSKNILYDSLSNNIHNQKANIRLLQCRKSIDDILSLPIKIDVLIIDDIDYKSDILAIYSKYVFSFLKTKIKHQIFLKKPLNFPNFLQEVNSALLNDKAFIFIDGNIYCELRSSFTSRNGEVIKLSHIENLVLKRIILSDDYFVTKESLKENVWKYSKKSETKTIEQSMHNLRMVLPEGFLAPLKDGYKIFGKEIY